MDEGWRREYLARLMSMITEVRAGMEALPDCPERDEMARLLEKMERIAGERLG